MTDALEGKPRTTDPVYSRADVAARAGLDEDFVSRLCELGILVSGANDLYSEGDVRRAQILHSLDAAGMPMDKVAEGIQRGVLRLDFVDAPAYEMFAGLTGETFAEASERTGVPFDLLAGIREATGSPLPAPEDRLRPVELDVIPAVALELQNGVRPQAVERQLRSYGENLRRIAEVEADWWMSEVIVPAMQRGGSVAAVGPETADFSNALQALSERMLVALFRGHQMHAWMKNMFEGFESGMTRAGLYDPIERPPAICFLDLSGYTRLTDQRGDAAAADLAGRLSRLVQRTSAQHGGKPIKWLGDGVMFHFRDPGPGVIAALEMVEGARESDLPPAHVGLHAGPVLFQEGDYFGRTVNVASRIADYARQGEVLVSDEVVAASPDIEGVRFEAIGPVELKGLTETIALHVARRA